MFIDYKYEHEGASLGSWQSPSNSAHLTVGLIRFPEIQSNPPSLARTLPHSFFVHPIRTLMRFGLPVLASLISPHQCIPLNAD